MNKELKTKGRKTEKEQMFKKKVKLDNALATWCEELTQWKWPWCWERLKAEGNDRGWDGWMASPMQPTWVWVNSGSWWRTGGLAWWSPWSHRVRHNLATELNWKDKADAGSVNWRGTGSTAGVSNHVQIQAGLCSWAHSTICSEMTSQGLSFPICKVGSVALRIQWCVRICSAS